MDWSGREAQRGWQDVRKAFGRLGNASVCESVLVAITRLHTFLQTGM